MRYGHNIAFEDTVADQAAALAERLHPLIGSAPSIISTLTELVGVAREWACVQVEDFNRPNYYGHCDTCGAACDEDGCTWQRDHVVALSADDPTPRIDCPDALVHLEVVSERLARTMDQLVGRLPDTDEGPIRLSLDYGDIRGVLVRLVLPDAYARMHTTFSGDGIGVES